MKFEIGCDLEEFREYWNRSGYDGNLDHLLNVVVKDSTQLIVWKENDRIVGHAVWHETNIEEHRKGDPRDKEDRETLKKLLGKKKDFVELHEWWLIEKHRGKSYGNDFLDFFEAYMKNKGYFDLVFYADHPAALATFRKRGYKEGEYLKELKEHAFHIHLEQRP